MVGPPSLPLSPSSRAAPPGLSPSTASRRYVAAGHTKGVVVRFIGCVLVANLRRSPPLRGSGARRVQRERFRGCTARRGGAGETWSMGGSVEGARMLYTLLRCALGASVV